MFTGLIEAVCMVKSVRRAAGAMRLDIDLGGLAEKAEIGDSIAVNGVCLTIAALAGRTATFDISSETLAKSTLAELKSSSAVNAERALKALGRFGGHFVQGHVDGIATITGIEKNGQFASIRFSAESKLLDQMVSKGSVAVDGISLTIADMDEKAFSAAIIPETLKKTTLGAAKIGRRVNIETDIIVKTVKAQLEKILPQPRSLTAEKLKELGF